MLYDAGKRATKDEAGNLVVTRPQTENSIPDLHSPGGSRSAGKRVRQIPAQSPAVLLFPSRGHAPSALRGILHQRILKGGSRTRQRKPWETSWRRYSEDNNERKTAHRAGTSCRCALSCSNMGCGGKGGTVKRTCLAPMGKAWGLELVPMWV